MYIYIYILVLIKLEFIKVFIVSTIEPIMVIIEYVPHGDLLGYLRKSRGLNDTYYKDPDVKPNTNLTSQQLIKFAWQVADGMDYLSNKKVGYVFEFKVNRLVKVIYLQCKYAQNE